MPDVQCARSGQSRAAMAAPPLPTELGARIYDSVCQVCWQEWLQHQMALINHYGMKTTDPEAKQFLTRETEAFFFGAPRTE